MVDSPFDSSGPGDGSSSGRGRDDADSKFGEILGKFFGSVLPTARPRRRDKPSPMDRNNAEHLLRPSASPDIDPAHTDLRATGAFGFEPAPIPLSAGEGAADDLLIAELRIAAANARGQSFPRSSQTAEFVATERAAAPTPSDLSLPLPGSEVSMHVLRYFFGDEAGVVAAAPNDDTDVPVSVAQVVEDDDVEPIAVVMAQAPQPVADRTAFAPTVDFITARRPGDSNTPSDRGATPFPEFDASVSRVRVAASIASLLDSSPGGPSRPSDSALLAAEVVSRSSPGEGRGTFESGVVELALKLTARFQAERARGATLPLIPLDARPPVAEVFVDQNADTTPPLGVAPVPPPLPGLVIEGQTVVIDGDELMDHIAAASRREVTPLSGSLVIPSEARRDTPPFFAQAAAEREAPTMVTDGEALAAELDALRAQLDQTELAAPPPTRRQDANTFIELTLPQDFLRARPEELAQMEPAPLPAPPPVASPSVAPGTNPVLGTIMRKRRTGPLTPVADAHAADAPTSAAAPPTPPTRPAEVPPPRHAHRHETITPRPAAAPRPQPPRPQPQRRPLVEERRGGQRIEPLPSRLMPPRSQGIPRVGAERPAVPARPAHRPPSVDALLRAYLDDDEK